MILDSTNIDTFKVGSNQVDKIYLGADEVWSNVIPAELTYIDSGGVSSLGIGADVVGRKVIIAIHTVSGTDILPTSVTVNSVSGTLLASTGVDNYTTSVWSFENVVGTTSNVIVTASGSYTLIQLHSYTLFNSTVIPTVTVHEESLTIGYSLTTDINVLEGDAMMVLGYSSSFTTTLTFIGVTSRYQSSAYTYRLGTGSGNALADNALYNIGFSTGSQTAKRLSVITWRNNS